MTFKAYRAAEGNGYQTCSGFAGEKSATCSICAVVGVKVGNCKAD